MRCTVPRLIPVHDLLWRSPSRWRTNLTLAREVVDHNRCWCPRTGNAYLGAGTSRWLTWAGGCVASTAVNASRMR